MRGKVLLLFVFSCCVLGESSSEYLATVHHSANKEYVKSKARSVNEIQFVAKLIYNNTLDSNGQVTIKMCDITKDLFDGETTFPVFNTKKSGGIGSVVEAEVSAYMEVIMQIDGCLVFFFDPCCGSMGFRVALTPPFVLAARGGVEANIEALGGTFGGGGKTDIDFYPLNNINLGFSPVLGSWNLPPILNQFADIKNQQFCAPLGIPGTNFAIKFCIKLNNLTSVAHGINVCPRLTVSIGSRIILDMSYTKTLKGANNLPECLNLDFLPTCPVSSSSPSAGSSKTISISPNIVELFKSSDWDGDFSLTKEELTKAKALLGIFSTETEDSVSFIKMDTNEDNKIDFTEFHNYTAVQETAFNNSAYIPPKSKSTSYSGGDIAIAVIATMVATTLVVGIALVLVAQYKGIIKLDFLSKVIPTKV